MVAYPCVSVVRGFEPIAMAEPRQRLAVVKFLDGFAILLTDCNDKPSSGSSLVTAFKILVPRMSDNLETSELFDIVVV